MKLEDRIVAVSKMTARPTRKEGRYWWFDMYRMIERLEQNIHRIRSNETAILRLRDMPIAIDTEQEAEKLRGICEEIIAHIDARHNL